MLTLTRPIATALLKQAQSAPDRCIGGLLLGENGEAVQLRALPNAATDPARDYAFDAESIAATQRDAQDRGLALLALYHSHPDAPPVPSAAELAASPAPEHPRLVISLNTKGVLEMRAFANGAAGVTELPLQIFN